MAQNGSGDRVEKGVVEEDEDLQNLNQKDLRHNKEDDISVERLFLSREVPPWRHQLTIRALVVSFLLSILFSFIVMKLNLTTGIIPSLNVSAGLLGFFFVKTWTKFLDKSHMLRQPFTRQENTVIQTCVVASSGIAFSGTLSNSILIICGIGISNAVNLETMLFCCGNESQFKIYHLHYFGIEL